MLNINDVMYQVCDMHIRQGVALRGMLETAVRGAYEEGFREEIEQHFFAE